MQNKILISCIIIGRNSVKELKKLLESINNQTYIKQNIEIIYIDDYSNDNSINLFNSFQLKFPKNCYAFKKQVGRMHARLKGVKLAQGEWCLFVNSTVCLEQNTISAYFKMVNNSEELGYSGSIVYNSKDQIFQTYLNNNNRGSNKLNPLSEVPYYNVLLSNCVINKKYLLNLNYKQNFLGYGGEELDFIYNLYSQSENKKIKLLNNAVVLRNNHPSFIQHLKRLKEFGEHNFIYLNKSIQYEIIKYPIILKKNILIFLFLMLLNQISKFCYNTPIKKVNFFFIKLGMWTSILIGYNNSK